MSFKWEVRLIAPIYPASIVLYSFNTSYPSAEVAAAWFAIVAAFLMLVADGIFSILVTAAYLRPVVAALDVGSGTVTKHFPARRRLRNTKWANVFGCGTAVASSTLFCQPPPPPPRAPIVPNDYSCVLPATDILLFRQERARINNGAYYDGIWMYEDFGRCLFSISNDFGMALLCGAFTKASFIGTCPRFVPWWSNRSLRRLDTPLVASPNFA